MSDHVIHVQPASLTMTGMNFLVYADRYSEAAQHIESVNIQKRFDPVLCHLYCLGLELYLKSFIWLKDALDNNAIKERYGHNLNKLWIHSKVRGIDRYASVTELRDSVISVVSPYYKDRKFSYLDLDMIFRGFKNLRAEARTIPTLRRLDVQLGKSLRPVILRAT